MPTSKAQELGHIIDENPARILSHIYILPYHAFWEANPNALQIIVVNVSHPSKGVPKPHNSSTETGVDNQIFSRGSLRGGGIQKIRKVWRRPAGIPLFSWRPNWRKKPNLIDEKPLFAGTQTIEFCAGEINSVFPKRLISVIVRIYASAFGIGSP